MKLSLTRLPLLLLVAATAACTASTGDDAQGDEEDLTSLTARSRKLVFASQVYVPAGASEADIE
ncbi:MAG TPA: hypothetical protein VIF62_13680, partial [Labilithrix sp.]